MYAFISNLEDFDTPLLIGLPAGIYLLPTLIFFSAFAGARPQFGLSSAYASIFLIITGLLVLVYLLDRPPARQPLRHDHWQGPPAQRVAA